MTWTLTEASKNLNEVCDLALDEGPQIVALQDGDSVVILSSRVRTPSPAFQGHQGRIAQRAPLRGIQGGTQS